MFSRFHKPYRKLMLAAVAAGLFSTGCGRQYVLLHPVGPVGTKELHLIELAALAMAIVIVITFTLFFYAVVRYRDTPGNKAPYRPNWSNHRLLEIIWWVLPAVLLVVIAVPTVKVTYALAKVPKAKDPVVIDVTSMTWKWLFEYPSQKVATVNYLEIPTGEPVLFQLTADSPMNTLWIPQLGGMEFTMPNRVLPLWLEAKKPGTYWGDSGNYSGTGFAKMFFKVKAVPPKQFAAWASKVHANATPMTNADFKKLLKHNTVGKFTYGAYPQDTFPPVASGFSLNGKGMYMIMHTKHDKLWYMPMKANQP